MPLYDTLLLCTGGIDSVVMTHLAIQNNRKCRLFYGNFGKIISGQELAIVSRLGAKLRLPLEVVDVKGLAVVQRQYDSTESFREDELDIDIGKTGSHVANPTRADGQYVTGFHCVLSVASYVAHLTDASSISIAATKEQFDGYGTLAAAFSQWGQCLASFNPDLDVNLEIETPFADLTKSEVIQLGERLGVDYNNTWSCVCSDSLSHCGECKQCQSRKNAFAAAGVKDPTMYLK